MINTLLDIRPGPAPIAGWGGLILLVVIVSTLVVGFLIAFVFLLRWLIRRKKQAQAIGADFQKAQLGSQR